MILPTLKQALISCTLAEIDFSDRSFPFSYGPLPDAFTASVRRAGILVPPLLQPGPRGYVIVCGRRRLEAARRTMDEKKEIPALLAAEDESKKQLFALAFWDNIAHRTLNLVEAADVLVVLESLFDECTMHNDYLPRLGIAPKPRFLQRCRTIARLPESARAFLARGKMDGETVDLLRGWQVDEVDQLVSMAEGITINRNKLKEIVALTTDLAGRDRTRPAELLSLIAEQHPECLESAAAWRRQLEKWMYPFLSAAEDHFRAWHQSLPLTKNMKIVPPPAFEGSTYTLQVNFRDAGQWQTALERLTSLETEKIYELFSR